jgi:hypothetical protein
MELDKKLEEFIEANKHMFNEIDNEMLVKLIMSEIDCGSSVKMLEINKIDKDGKQFFKSNDERLNDCEDDSQVIGYVWLFNQHLKDYGIKISVAAAFYSLVAISVPMHCGALAYVTNYLCKKHGFDYLTMERLTYIYDKGLPNRKFMSMFWDIVKQDKNLK